MSRNASVRILIGDVRARLAELPDDSVDCVVTSPPYWGLRDYGTAAWDGGSPECDHQLRIASPDPKALSKPGQNGRPPKGEEISRQVCRCGAVRRDFQIGLEPSWQTHVETIADVFEDVRRVLKPEGTLWLNYGDSYATSVNGRTAADTKATGNDDRTFRDKPFSTVGGVLKPKDLCGIPWRVAFALQERGWWLRQDIIWSKPNPMPESIRDRCTKAHEYLFLLSKRERYYFDQESFAEPVAEATIARLSQDVESQAGSDRVPGKTNGPMKAVGRRPKAWDEDMGSNRTLVAGYERQLGSKGSETPGEVRSSAGARMGRGAGWRDDPSTTPLTRNRRSVWTVNTQPFSEAHFATFPPALIEPCILAGCPVGGTVLDPFFGAGTTGLVADRLGRNCIGIELNPEYAAMAERRIAGDSPMFAKVHTEAIAEEAA